MNRAKEKIYLSGRLTTEGGRTEEGRLIYGSSVKPPMEMRLRPIETGERSMTLTSGGKIVYPSQGPCLVGPVVERNIAGTILRFYQLIVLDEAGGDLFVPLDKIFKVGIRPLLGKDEIPRLLAKLKKRKEPVDTWRERNLNNLKLVASGSAFDLAEVVTSLETLRKRKGLSFHESKMLEKARRLLVGEMSEVMGMSREDVEEQVDVAFGSGVERLDPVRRQQQRTSGVEYLKQNRSEPVSSHAGGG